MTGFSPDVRRAAEQFDLTYRDTAVYFLGGPLEDPAISVLARTESAFEEARRLLARARVEPYVFTAAGIRGTPGG
jgi:hypothetical protein